MLRIQNLPNADGEFHARRVVNYAKDIESMTGRKRTALRKLIRQIKIRFKKDRNEFITVREFSLFKGIDEETVFSGITNSSQ